MVPAARQGILTGMILGVARIAGETAPLLFTSLNNQFWAEKLTEPTASLPVMIYNWLPPPTTIGTARLGPPDWCCWAWC